MFSYRGPLAGRVFFRIGRDVYDGRDMTDGTDAITINRTYYVRLHCSTLRYYDETMTILCDILKKIGAIQFDNWNVTQARMSKKTFAAILMDPVGDSSMMDPVYQSMRTVTEKWNDLQHLGFAKLLNKTTVDFNIPRIREYIDLEDF